MSKGHQIVLSSVTFIQQQGNKKVTGTIARPERGTNHRGECGRERIYLCRYHHFI